MIVEIGLITPPLGMNLFIVHRQASDVPFLNIAKSVVPFLVSDLFRILILLFFPAITLFLLRFYSTPMVSEPIPRLHLPHPRPHARCATRVPAANQNTLSSML